MLDKIKNFLSVTKIKLMALPKKYYVIGGVVLLIILVIIFKKGAAIETAVVERGDVTRSVLVYGQLEHEQEARIGFATGGRISRIGGKVGDRVYKGQLLLQVEAGAELARAASAQADLTITEAQKRATTATLANLKDQLESTKQRSLATIDASRKVLFSSDLVAFAQSDYDNTMRAPIVSGTYLDTKEGEYYIKIYPSAAKSGYSFTTSGLEKSSGEVSYLNPTPLGTKGLLIYFVEGYSYGNTEWRIPVPNKQGASYAFNVKSYNESLKAGEATTLQIKDTYDTLAIKENSVGSVSSAEVARSRASLNEAYAAVTGRSIYAPFSGTLARIDATVGEFAEAGKSLVAVIAGDPITVKVNIPQVDIVEVVEGMPAVVSIEQSDRKYDAVVTRIDKVEQAIDGVPTYGATIKITNPDAFLRSGMEVSAEIITQKKTGVLRIPLDSVYTNTTAVILVHNNKKDKDQTNIQVNMKGTDGFVEITGLNEGDMVLRNLGESKKVDSKK